MVKNRVRNNLVKVYLSDNEYKAMREKIKACGNINKSVFLRRLIVRGEIKIYDFQNLGHLSEQIGRVGNNINQIAKRLNQGSKLEKNEAKEMETFLKEINQILKKIYDDIFNEQ